MKNLEVEWSQCRFGEMLQIECDNEIDLRMICRRRNVTIMRIDTHTANRVLISGDPSAGESRAHRGNRSGCLFDPLCIGTTQNLRQVALSLHQYFIRPADAAKPVLRATKEDIANVIRDENVRVNENGRERHAGTS